MTMFGQKFYTAKSLGNRKASGLMGLQLFLFVLGAIILTASFLLSYIIL